MHKNGKILILPACFTFTSSVPVVTSGFFVEKKKKNHAIRKKCVATVFHRARGCEFCFTHLHSPSCPALLTFSLSISLSLSLSLHPPQLDQKDMDYVVHAADQFILNDVYPKTWPAEDPIRQFITLFVIVNVTGALMYLSMATFSYYFIFDHEVMKHPKFLKNQVRFVCLMIVMCVGVDECGGV